MTTQFFGETEIAEDLDFDFHKENLINQMSNPHTAVKKNFLNMFVDNLESYIEVNEIEDEETLNEIRYVRGLFVSLIRENLEQYWDTEFDFDDGDNEETVIAVFYKLFINRDKVLINALTQYLKSAGNRNEIIKSMELNPSADDVTTVAYKKLFKRNDATILSNISNVIEYVIDSEMTDCIQIFKKSNKFKNKKFLDKCLKHLDKVEDPDAIYERFQMDITQIDYKSEIAMQVTDKLGNIFETKQ